jgi:hypothetical protein
MGGRVVTAVAIRVEQREFQLTVEPPMHRKNGSFSGRLARPPFRIAEEGGFGSVSALFAGRLEHLPFQGRTE